ncbi:MAG TPA: PH domain-containing protein [Methylomirabilota bacterium]|nr:PH domain-containing protein [Methylomirabilota bacterium]
MVTYEEVKKQLKKLDYNYKGWGRTEVKELPSILLPDEKIFELVNGIYENGFALLVATDIRVLLVDKKPLNYLTVEDLRFDMINEMDYSHRLIGARINISAGSKNLSFQSYNQAKLRKLIGHVQHCMADLKKEQSNHQEDQNEHLGQINKQLQSYLVAQQQHQLQLQQQLVEAQKTGVAVTPLEPVKPSPELSDYLLAQSLLNEHQARTGQAVTQLPAVTPPSATVSSQDLQNEGIREIFGRHELKRKLGSAVLLTP